ncbi:MAG: TOBE domain-containing protein, partial [Pseudomonadota bacterium]
NLDASLRVATRIEIAQLKESMPNSTMIYVTHDQVEAMTLASRIVVLANKGIAQVGTPLELYETPENEFVAQFIGSPAMNLMPGEIVMSGEVTEVKLDNGYGLIKANIPTTDADRGLKVNVGIRPEDMVVTKSDDFAFRGEVAITEKLGEVTQIYFKPVAEGASQVIAKLAGIHNGMRGQVMSMTADPSKVHLFSNGQSLIYR